MTSWLENLSNAALLKEAKKEHAERPLTQMFEMKLIESWEDIDPESPESVRSAFNLIAWHRQRLITYLESQGAEA